MSVRRKTTKDLFPSMQRQAQALHGARVQVGVMGQQAWLAAIHEYGCRIPVTAKMRAYLAATGFYLRASTTVLTIPERSFLRTGFDACHDDVLQQCRPLVSQALSGKRSARTVAETAGLVLAGKIKEHALGVRAPANHPYTVAQKHSSHPLVDTGEMIGAITYEVVT